MKKVAVFILFFVLGVSLIACKDLSSNENNDGACVFTEVSVSDGYLSYTRNEACEQVFVEVFDSSSRLIGTYEDSSINFNYVLNNGTYSFLLKGYGYVQDELVLLGSSTEMQMIIEQSLHTTTLENDLLNNDAYIRYLGRTSYDDETSSRTMYFSGSGFEVGFFGTELTVTMIASNTNLQDQPYFVVFLDGETNPNNGTLWFLFQPESTYQLVSGLDEGYHTVRIVKRNEATDSTIALKHVSTDGYMMNPSEEKTLKIEFVGASTMTGYGNLASKPSESKTSENSNVLFAYTYLSAYYLDAEYSIIAASGWGVSRGYNTGGVIDEVRNMPNAYDFTGITDQGLVTEDLPWNSNLYDPDILVISLGSNDLNSTGYNSMTSENQQLFDEQFENDFLAFISHVHELHPDAIIILAYGILSDNVTLENKILALIDAVDDDSIEIYSCKLTPAGANDIPFGSDYHPSVATHLIATKELADFIASVTDYEIIHSEITQE